MNLAIFNITTETNYSDFASPLDTQWAYGTTADIATLTFQDWETTHNSDPTDIVNQDMVLHLITDDIYMDIKFLSWTTGDGNGTSGGGGFSYQRSTDQTANTSEFSSLKEIKLFPNPATGFIQFSNVTETANYQIYDILGGKISHGSLLNKKEVSVQHLTSGLYFITINNGDKIKFIKK